MKLRRKIACVVLAATCALMGFGDIADRSKEAFSVDVYADSTSIGGGSVTYSITAGKATITKFNPTNAAITNVILPSSLGGKPVTAIDGFAFENCTNLQHVQLPDTLTALNDNAFAYCSELRSISLPSGVTKIGISCFMNCTSLTVVELNEGLTGIANKAFQSCTALTSIDIPSTVTAVGNYSFKKCKALKTINFKGNAPRAGDSDPLDGCPADLVVTYRSGTSGWGSTWCGHACIPYGGSVEISTETTTVTTQTTQATTQATTQTTQATTAGHTDPRANDCNGGQDRNDHLTAGRRQQHNTRKGRCGL